MIAARLKRKILLAATVTAIVLSTLFVRIEFHSLCVTLGLRVHHKWDYAIAFHYTGHVWVGYTEDGINPEITVGHWKCLN